jgi:multicomponent Na+:H+ antiporter subunit B
MHDLFAIVMLMNIYGLLSASFFVLMDAVDVALTEAAVGLGISTLLLLSTLSFTGRFEKTTRHKPLQALLVVIFVGLLLIYGTLEMPPFGSATAPVHQHVASYYINESYAQTGIINLVSSVLASYRGFDTMGELFVIFAAGTGVFALLGINANDAKKQQSNSNSALPLPMHQHHILRIVSKILIPLILLFALYIQFHGDFGPGGGFQAGVIFASAIILYTMIFGLQAGLKVVNLAWLQFFAALGVLLYGSTGLVSLLLGGNFLDYNVLAQNPIEGQHLGILAVELGVGITVAAVIILIFMSFTGYMVKSTKRTNK